MKTSPSMCCVSIGYQTILLPADDGLKVVKLLQGAVLCEQNYDGGSGSDRYSYQVKSESLSVELTLLKASQVRMPEGSPAAPDPVRRSPRRRGHSLPLLERTR